MAEPTITRIKLLGGATVYTEEHTGQVLSFLHGGSKVGYIMGYEDEAKTVKIAIAVHDIAYVYI